MGWPLGRSRLRLFTGLATITSLLWVDMGNAPSSASMYDPDATRGPLGKVGPEGGDTCVCGGEQGPRS